MGLSKFVSFLLKTRVKSHYFRSFSESKKKPPWKIVFFGADEFSVFSLKALTEKYRKGVLLNRLEVVTTVKGKPNAVKLFAQKENLQLHKWPPSVSFKEFDLGVVVSFGHLVPKTIIDQFHFGMLNVHASLLPRWRGAAPIIYALANGDTETGITIMAISPEKFDIGKIVHQESVQIHPDMKQSELYTVLGNLGAKNLIMTLHNLPSSLGRAKPQPSQGVTYAPKINPSMAIIKWDQMTSQQIVNLERALDGIFPIQTTWKGTPVKLFNTKRCVSSISGVKNIHPGFAEYDKEKQVLKVFCCDSHFITVEKVGVVGKKVMSSRDFNNGYVKKEPPDSRYFK